MSYWNHRVLKESVGGEDIFTIREVHYNNDNSIYAYTTEPIYALGNTLKELRDTLERMLKCLDKEILVYGEIEFKDTDDDAVYNPE